MIRRFSAGSPELAAALAEPVDRTVICMGSEVYVHTGEDVIPVSSPQEVTRRQFLQGLSRLGLRTQVEAWIAQQSQDAQDWYHESLTMQRSNKELLAAAAHFGLADAEVDAAFVMMAAL